MVDKPGRVRRMNLHGPFGPERRLLGPTIGPAVHLAWVLAFVTSSAALAGASCTSEADPPPVGETTGSSSSGETSSSSSSDTGFDDDDACAQSEDCETDGSCAAPYDPGLGQPGPAICVDTCIADGDLARWCVDDQACCAGLWCSAVDGFCFAGEGGSSTDGSESSSSDASESSSDGVSGSTESSGSSGSTGDETTG